MDKEQLATSQASLGTVPPGYKRTEVGVIPEDWSAMPLRDDVKLISGHHVLSQYCNTTGDGIPYLTGPADFPNGQIKQTKFTTKPTTLCDKEDILITVKGSGSGTIIDADSKYCISRQLMAIRVMNWNSKFLFYSLLQHSSQIKDSSTGLIPGLSRPDILNRLIAVPEEQDEQRAIAEALSDVDGLIASLDKLLAKKRAIKQAAMQQLLTGKTRLPGFGGMDNVPASKASPDLEPVPPGYKRTEVGVIPEDWEVKSLNDLGTFCKGRGIKRDDLSDDGVACVRYGEIYTTYNNYLTKLSSRIPQSVAKTSLFIKSGDLLFAGSGETAEEIGKCVAYLGDEEAYAGGDIVVLRIFSEDNPLYLGHLLNQEVAVQQKISLGQGDAVVHISASNLGKISFPLPEEVSEQHAIASVLSDIDAEIAALEKRRDKTKQIKQGMMQELLTGRVRLIKETP